VGADNQTTVEDG